MGDGASNSHLSYCRISNSIHSGIASHSSGIVIDNSEISYNGLDEQWGAGGIFLMNSTLEISNSSIHHNDNYYYWGGGLSIFENSSAYLQNVDISYNYSHGDGGGIRAYDSEIVLQDVLISENMAEYSGGGLASSNSPLTILNSEISRNSTLGAGGGLSIEHWEDYGWGSRTSDLRELQPYYFKGVKIDQNSADMGGGVVLHGHSDLIFSDVYITRNVAHSDGGGMALSYSNPRLVNVTMAANEAGSNEGNGMLVGYRSEVALINSIVWDEVGSSNQDIRFVDNDTSQVLVAFCDIQNGEEVFTYGPDAIAVVHWESGNISSNPIFTYPDSGNYAIEPESPCVNAGIDEFIWEGELLVDLTDDEFVGPAPDIGAVQVGLPGSNEEEPLLPEKFALFDNYPNPFNNSTSLRFALPYDAKVELVIYDILGREVTSLISEQKEAGEHIIQWNGQNISGSNSSTGVYLLRIMVQETGSDNILYTHVKKMVLIK